MYQFYNKNIYIFYKITLKTIKQKTKQNNFFFFFRKEYVYRLSHLF